MPLIVPRPMVVMRLPSAMETDLVMDGSNELTGVLGVTKM
jgi:hypothetical protein